jgi:hypothetical protein
MCKSGVICGPHDGLQMSMGVQPINHIRMSTPHTKDQWSFVYPAKIQFPGLALLDSPILESFQVVGCDLRWTTFDEKEIIMLLGRDLLKHFLMVYNGVQSDVTLAY